MYDAFVDKEFYVISGEDELSTEDIDYIVEEYLSYIQYINGNN